MVKLQPIFLGFLLSFAEAEDCERKASKRTLGAKSTKATKMFKSTKATEVHEPKTSTVCTSETWSIINQNPNDSWNDHIYHTQVWYHTLEAVHSLWEEDYFDYVLDVRPLQDFTIDSNGLPLLLDGWETFHIPGSFPIAVFPPDTPADEVEMLVDFTSTNVCKDARIFVHCWSGIAGNRVAQTLIELGFTNVHAAGPQGTAGIWDWKAAGYELVHDDTFDAMELQPECMSACGA